MSNKNQKLLHQQNTAFKLMKFNFFLFWFFFFNNESIKFNAIEDAVHRNVCYCLQIMQVMVCFPVFCVFNNFSNV